MVIATAAVAGLLAYFMAQGKSGADARKQLFDKAYPRITNGPKVVWNLIDIRNNGAGGSGGGDGGDGGDITESNKCHGIDGDSWIWDRNTAVDAAKDFCGQGDTPKECAPPQTAPNPSSSPFLSLPLLFCPKTKAGKTQFVQGRSLTACATS